TARHPITNRRTFFSTGRLVFLPVSAWGSANVKPDALVPPASGAHAAHGASFRHGAGRHAAASTAREPPGHPDARAEFHQGLPCTVAGAIRVGVSRPDTMPCDAFAIAWIVRVRLDRSRVPISSVTW